MGKKAQDKEEMKQTLMSLKKIMHEFGAIREHYRDICDEDLRWDLIKAEDAMAALKHELMARTDGRPQALDFGSLYDYETIVRANPNDEGIKKQAKAELKKLKEWAYCYPRGKQEEKASLGRLTFTREELVKIRDWIEGTIKFHEVDPGKTVLEGKSEGE